jgi:hypothetical protein
MNSGDGFTDGLRAAAAIIRREIERVDAILPERKGTTHSLDKRKVTLSSVVSEYKLIEREIMSLANGSPVDDTTKLGGG